MTGARPAEILRQLEQSGEPDAELLARFAATKDSNAFAELVRRHAALVFGVCRRVTGHPQDAEDAFQATFLVLAKKAAAIRNASLLGNWLYGVAFRIAWKARRSAVRRRTREVSVATPPDVPAPAPLPATPELTPVLDEELAGLSACYRDAIVMCDLRGMSRTEAATALGIPEGTLSSRLANGRKKLAARLTKRGIALSVATLPAALSEATASGAVPNELISKTCGLVADFTVGGAVPRPLARLANGGFTMRKSLMLVVLLAFTVGGAVFAARNEDAPLVDPPKPPVVVAEKPEAVPQPKEESKPSERAEFTTRPKLQFTTDVRLWSVRTFAWRSDGKFLAVQGSESNGKQTILQVACFDLLERSWGGLPSPVDVTGSLVGFTPDGRELVTAIREPELLSGIHRLRLFSVPPEARLAQFNRQVELDPDAESHHVFLADAKKYRTVRASQNADGTVSGLEVLEVEAGTGKTKSSFQFDKTAYAFSPDGKRLACLTNGAKKVAVFDLDRGTKLSEFTFPADIPEIVAGKHDRLDDRLSGTYFVFSPEGRFVVVSRSVGATYVLDADEGTVLPALEDTKGARTYPKAGALSADGRLLVAPLTAYKFEKVYLNGQDQMLWNSLERDVLAVWDVRTGKRLKTWSRKVNQSLPLATFSPTKPLLAIFEPKGNDQTRVGFWDFAAEVEKK